MAELTVKHRIAGSATPSADPVSTDEVKMNSSRRPRRCASTTGSAPRADTMAGCAESSLRSSIAPTQDYEDIVEVVQAPTHIAMAHARATDNFEERESPSEITDSSARANELHAESNLKRKRRRGWQRWAAQNHRSGQRSLPLP